MSARFLNLDWCGLDWTEWRPLSAKPARGEGCPQRPGFYRVKITGRNQLAYIGQTGNSLRGRVGMLRLNVYRSKLPWNDPHTAAPGLWAWRVDGGLDYEVSCAAMEIDKAARQCHEDFLLYEYRCEAGESTLCNHGHFHPNWRRPSSKKDGRCMIRIANSKQNAAEPSLAPVKISGNPSDRQWLGLPWTAPCPNGKDAKGIAGVYKLLSDGAVVYLGESRRDISGRFKSHRNRWNNGLKISWIEMPASTDSQRRERETDLIGAYFKTEKRCPRFQYRANELL